MIIVSLLIFFLYGFFIVNYIRANKSYDLANRKSKAVKTVSVIIPYRNEAEHLVKLIHSLFSLHYPKEAIEFIFIDDHSSDNSTAIIVSSCKAAPFDCKIIALSDETGKKAALKKGIESSTSEIILTTDADCTMGIHWASSMVSCFVNTDIKLLIGPVKLERGNSLFTSLQQLEFAAVMACTSGAAILKKPIACNGANLGFTRKLYETLRPYESNLHIASGDDMFFLFAAKKVLRNTEIAFVSNPAALVETQVINSIRGFVSQRIRWVKKAKYFEDWDSKKFGMLMMAVNLLLVIQLLFSLIFNTFYALIIASFFVKYLLDTFLLLSIRRWNPIDHILLKSFFLSIIFPFYLLNIALLSLLTRTKWKGRIVVK